MSTVTAGGAVGATAEGLDDVELALVNGGPRLAAITAVVALRRAEVLDVGANMLVAHGELPEEACELQRELFDVVRQTPATSARDAVAQSAQSATARRLIARLTNAGLLRDEDAARRLRSLVWALMLVWLVALAVVALILADHAIALVPLGAAVVSAAVAAWWLHAEGGRTTGAGRRLIKRTRAERCDELRGTPPSNLALAVALFGVAALWAADPLFAFALGVAHDEAVAVGGHVDAFLAGHDAACGGCGCGGCG